jgi:WYL domain
VRLSPRGRSLLDLLGSYVQEAVTKTAGPPDRRGWVRCTIPLENADFGVRELMRLGPDVEVISPRTLRVQMTMTLRRALRNYESGSSWRQPVRTDVVPNAADSGTKSLKQGPKAAPLRAALTGLVMGSNQKAE